MHILDMPPGGLTLPGWGRKAEVVRLLADKRPLNFIQSAAVTVLEVCVT